MVVKKAHKYYFKSVEGKTYIDTTMGSGAQIIGHNNPLIRKVKSQISKGTIYTIPNHHTEDVNKLLFKINPTLYSNYIFCNSGTEANMRAIRLARAYTGKSLIGRFHGGWHGGLDGFLNEHPDYKGVPNATNKLFKVLPYNDDRCFNSITSEMAAIIIEPVQGSNPRSDIKEFLQKLEIHCRKIGVLIILDEVMTGFRLGKKGGSGIFNITPDIVTYGKVLGGGFPIGAVGGREDILNTPNVFFGGTFSANPLSMYSTKLILENIIKEKYIKYDFLFEIGEIFRNSLNTYFISNDIKIRAMGCGPINRLIFTDKPVKNRKERDKLESTYQNVFYKELLKNGVFVNGNRIFHLSMCHNKKVIDNIVNSIIKVIDNSYEKFH